MKDQYIRQVKKELNISQRAKIEVVRDLNEIFSSAAEHGETEHQVIERLGTPKEFADSMAEQLGSDSAPQKRRELGLTIFSAAAAVAAFVIYTIAKAADAPDGAIGQADAMTSIQIAGTAGFDALQIILAVGVIAAVFAVIQISRVVRSRRHL